MSQKVNYQKLMELNPTSYGKIVNEKGQEIEFYEHPTEGDFSPIICACHSLKLAAYSDFFDTVDMEKNKDYEPSFDENQNLIIGY